MANTYLCEILIYHLQKRKAQFNFSIFMLVTHGFTQGFIQKCKSRGLFLKTRGVLSCHGKTILLKKLLFLDRQKTKSFSQFFSKFLSKTSNDLFCFYHPFLGSFVALSLAEIDLITHPGYSPPLYAPHVHPLDFKSWSCSSKSGVLTLKGGLYKSMDSPVIIFHTLHPIHCGVDSN